MQIKIRFMSVRILSLIFIAVFAGCGINQQAKQIKAFENCKFEVRQVDSVYLAGMDVERLLQKGDFNPGNIAFAMLSKDVPLTGLVHMQISNPGKDLAGINEFQYRILIKDQELANGVIDQKIKIAAGESMSVPVKVQSNVYGLLSNGKVLEELLNFISKKQETSNTEFTIKLKPTIAIGNKQVNYPGWITFDRKISRSLFL